MTFKTGMMLAAAFVSAVTIAPACARDLVQQGRFGFVVTPTGSQEIEGMRGRSAHANVHIMMPTAPATANTPGGAYETPASLACVYRLVVRTNGCDPHTVTTLPAGGSRVIAIVDAYDDPNAASDLATYSAEFGLAPVTSANFQTVYASGTQPAADPSGAWSLEAALDIEMAHALAPGAKIVLVEAASNSYADLMVAETKAAQLVQAGGGGEVSNSWSGGEFPFEEFYTAYFSAANVVFLAATGDRPGPSFPSALTDVIAVGGTSIDRSSSLAYVGQTSWGSSGGGVSQYVATPAFQSGLSSMVGTGRGMPDISMNADPNTGVWVFDTAPRNGSAPGWLVVGGTSVATPALAAIINASGSFQASTTAELSLIYANRLRAGEFRDVTAGACANAPTGFAVAGYDLCTGIGTPFGLRGK